MKYKVICKTCGNIDHGQDPAQITTIDFYGDNIEDLQYIVRDYIDVEELGAGNWIGGFVYCGDEYIGKISYNGRFWDKNHKYGRIDIC